MAEKNLACRHRVGNCIKNRKSDKCSKPNAWIEHLIHEGGRGLTRAQIKARYAARGRGLSRQRLCRRARSYGRSHQQDLRKVHNLCTWARRTRFRPLDNNRHQQRMKVVQDLVRRHVFPTSDVPVASLTPVSLRRLYKAIDKSYFRGSLHKLIVQKSGHANPITFAVEEAYGASPLSAATTENLYGPRRCVIRFYRSMWGPGARHRQTDGVSGGPNQTKLEALLATMCHELTHALTFLACQINYCGHDEKFKRLNSILWGHSEKNYRYNNHCDRINL